jgi:hypothetical protein
MIFWKCKRKWKNENRVHSARPASAHGLDAVGPAHEPFWPAGVLGRLGALTRSPLAARVGWRAHRWPDSYQLAGRFTPQA